MVLTDLEFDEILHDCLILASAKEFEAIPIVEPEFTRSEARQIEKMLADPWKFALTTSAAVRGCPSNIT